MPIIRCSDSVLYRKSKNSCKPTTFGTCEISQDLCLLPEACSHKHVVQNPVASKFVLYLLRTVHYLLTAMLMAFLIFTTNATTGRSGH